jgi:Zn-dependent M16 (insulinase) family peptidase
VNYVGKAASLYDAGYELNGSAYVISKFIGNTWLWDRVRVSGGAYGGFCDFDSHSGSSHALDMLFFRSMEYVRNYMDFIHPYRCAVQGFVSC